MDNGHQHDKLYDTNIGVGRYGRLEGTEYPQSAREKFTTMPIFARSRLRCYHEFLSEKNELWNRISSY